MNKQKNAFTLVELIVVITILAILGTVAFISLQGYSKDARNSTRATDTASMRKTLELHQLKKSKYPMADAGIEIGYSGATLRTQGDFGTGVLKELSNQLSEAPKDPLLNTFYTYSVTNNKKEFEILTIFEGNDYVINTLNRANADSGFTPRLSGNYNGVFVKSPNYIIPTPSIINSEITQDDDLDLGNIGSQIVNGQENMIAIGEEAAKIDQISTLIFHPVNISSGSLADNKTNIIGAIESTYTATTLNQASIDYVLEGIENGDEDNIFNMLVLDQSSDTSSSLSNNTITYSCATTPNFSNLGITTEGTPISAGQSWIYNKTPGSCTYTCSNGYIGTNCLTATSVPGNDIYTVLLLHGEDFTDSSNYNSVLSQVGSPSIGNIDGKFGSYLDLIGSKNISVPFNSNYNFGTEDWTIDFWLRVPDLTRSYNLGGWHLAGHVTSNNLGYYLAADGSNIYFYNNNNTNVLQVAHGMSANVWNHVAYEQYNNILSIYINGNRVGSTSLSSVQDSSAGFAVGSALENSGEAERRADAQFDEFRISKGIARWKGNFTPYSLPYGD